MRMWRSFFLMFFLSVSVGAQDLSVPTVEAKPSFMTLSKVCELIQNQYVTPQFPEPQLEKSAILSMLKALQDPDTRYISASQAAQLRVKQGLVSGNRNKKETPSVPQSSMFGTIGYIKLSSFESINTGKQFIDALVTLKPQHLTCLILDLRDNRGGMFDQALIVLGALIDRAEVAYTVYRDGYRHPHVVNGKAIYGGPLLVLVNKNSASSSEIVAGAIQDFKRGDILGEKTFGKASVQEVFDLPDGSALIMTVAHYLTPKGTLLTQKGIIPDQPLLADPKFPGDSILQQALQRAIVEGYKKK